MCKWEFTVSSLIKIVTHAQFRFWILEGFKLKQI